MMYDFFYKRLGPVDLGIIENLKHFALQQTYTTLVYFVAENVTYTGEFTANEPAIAELVQSQNGLASYLDPAEFRSASIAKLAPMTYIKEHSDTNIRNKDGSYTGHPALQVHKVHVPIITNDHVLFAWLERNLKSGSGNNTVARFPVGSAYLFNNHDIHNVINGSETESRYHLILRYDAKAYING